MKKIILFFKNHFLLTDTLLIIFAFYTAFVILQKAGKQEFLKFIFDNKGQLYPLFFSAGITLLGFSMTGISIILIFLNDERLSLLRESGHFKSILGIYINAILIVAAFTISSFLGLILKGDSILEKLSFIVEIIIFIMATRIWRCIWIIEEISKILYKTTKQSQ